MQILRVSRKIATLYGICSISNEWDVRTKYFQAFVNVFVTVCLGLLLWFSIDEMQYQLKNGEITSCLFAVLHAVPLTSTMGSYFSVAFQMGKIRKIFNGMQKIFDQCNYVSINFSGKTQNRS